MNNKIKEQIRAISATGETNMFDAPKVREIAMREEYFELLDFLTDNMNAYIGFILTGK